jgi:hypothetical protein
MTKTCFFTLLSLLLIFERSVAFGGLRSPMTDSYYRSSLRATDVAVSHPAGPFLSPEFDREPLSYKSLEERILYPDDMDTVHDPLWPKLGRLDGEDPDRRPQPPRPGRPPSPPRSTGTPASRRPSQQGLTSEISDSRRLRLLSMQSLPDPQWPELAQLQQKPAYALPSSLEDE